MLIICWSYIKDLVNAYLKLNKRHIQTVQRNGNWLVYIISYFTIKLHKLVCNRHLNYIKLQPHLLFVKVKKQVTFKIKIDYECLQTSCQHFDGCRNNNIAKELEDKL